MWILSVELIENIQLHVGIGRNKSTKWRYWKAIHVNNMGSWKYCCTLDVWAYTSDFWTYIAALWVSELILWVPELILWVSELIVWVSEPQCPHSIQTIPYHRTSNDHDASRLCHITGPQCIQSINTMNHTLSDVNKINTMRVMKSSQWIQTHVMPNSI